VGYGEGSNPRKSRRKALGKKRRRCRSKSLVCATENVLGLSDKDKTQWRGGFGARETKGKDTTSVDR